MEFAMKRNSPTRSLSGFAVVVALHVAFAIALINGLVRPPLAPQQKDIDVTILRDTPKPLPMKDKPVDQPMQKVYVPTPVTPPPPDFQSPIVASTEPIPVPDRVAITQTSIQTGVISDFPVAQVGVACPNSQSVRTSMRYPPQARRDGLQGDVVARFLVAANGEIRNINIVSSTNRAFNSAVVSAVGQFSCLAQGRDVTVEVPFAFRLE